MTAALKLTALALLRITIPYCRVSTSSPQSPDVYSRLIVTNTCLYTSALLTAELGSCLHP